jgi:hypothetical protein
MSTTQITFTPAQITFLGKWFNQQKNAYTSAVMEDEFPADEESFQQLCEATYNVGGFKVGEMVERETGDTPSVGRKGKVKKEKKEKDPNAPKRAKTAYMNWLWSSEGMDKVKSENPDMTHKQAMSKAAEVWKGMDDVGKESWVSMSAEQKAEYEAAMKDYVAPDGGVKVVKVGKVVKVAVKVVDDVVVSQDVPDGVGGAQVNMYMRGMATKKRYDTLEDAVSAMDSVEGAGGVVYDGKNYSLRKSGDAMACSQPNILWVKN